MSDTEADKTPEVEKKDEEVHQAHVGHKDKGEKVSTVLGQRVDGRIADLADGD